MENKKAGFGTVSIHGGSCKNPYGTLAYLYFKLLLSYLTQQSKVEKDLH